MSIYLYLTELGLKLFLYFGINFSINIQGAMEAEETLDTREEAPDKRKEIEKRILIIYKKRG